LCVDERWGFTKLPKADTNFKAVWNTGRKCLVDGANIACANSTGNVLIVNSDDFFPCQDWDSKLFAVIFDNGLDVQHNPLVDNWDAEFVIRTHPGDKYQAWLDHWVIQLRRDPIISRLMTLQILSRARYQRFGYALYPEFTSMMADTDFTDAAEHDGVVIEARDIVIEHRHPFVTGAEQDSVSKHENETAAHELGARIFARRRAERNGGTVAATMPARKKIGVLMPGDTFDWRWNSNWSKLLIHLVSKYDPAWTFQACSNQYFARDFAWQTLLEHNKRANYTPDFVLWLDSDNPPPTPEEFELLLDVLAQAPEVSAIGGWYYINVEPPPICARVRDKNGTVRSVTFDEIQEAYDNLKLIEINDHMGFGALLMRWEVMACAGTWPFTPMLQPNWKEIMFNPLVDRHQLTIGPYKGDDVGFCHRAMERGFRFFLHPEVYLPHLKRNDVPGPKLKPRGRAKRKADSGSRAGICERRLNMPAKIHNYGSGDWGFYCPGCGHEHSFRVNGDTTRPQWEWNGSLDKPSFTPSLMVNKGTPSQCHLVVTDGKIQFQPDCHHALKGQTVEMKDWEQ